MIRKKKKSMKHEYMSKEQQVVFVTFSLVTYHRVMSYMNINENLGVL